MTEQITRTAAPSTSGRQGPRTTGESVGNRYNLAARAARWSAGHWKTAVAVWVAFVAIAIGLGTTLGTHTLSSGEQSTGETARAEQMLASAGFTTPAVESVLVRSSTR